MEIFPEIFPEILPENISTHNTNGNLLNLFRIDKMYVRATRENDRVIANACINHMAESFDLVIEHKEVCLI